MQCNFFAWSGEWQAIKLTWFHHSKKWHQVIRGPRKGGREGADKVNGKEEEAKEEGEEEEKEEEEEEKEEE